MTLYPEAQKRAQSELDQVLGGDRLPNFSDKDRLPYVHALLKEVLRWIPVLPLGNLRDCEGFVNPILISLLPQRFRIVQRMQTNIRGTISRPVPQFLEIPGEWTPLFTFLDY